jgi:carboxylesterase type B
VYAPAGVTNTSSLPVLLWIHGGSFTEGSNQGPLNLYDGSALSAAQNVVIVATNYRLNVMGFLVTNKLDGNYGFQDQVAAMRWTQRNVRNFGGNPESVTLWGQSAGAMSIGLHYVSGAAKEGLFARVLMESNPLSIGYQQRSSAKTYGHQIAKAVDCLTRLGLVDQDCLYAANATALMRAAENVKPIMAAEAEGGSGAEGAGAGGSGSPGGWGAEAGGALSGFALPVLKYALPMKPVVDDPGFPRDGGIPLAPMDAFAAGAFPFRIPVLIGTVEDEGATFIYTKVTQKPWPATQYLEYMAVLFQGDAPKVVAWYAQNRGFDNSTDGRYSTSTVLTDYGFRCPSHRVAQSVTAAGGVPSTGGALPAASKATATAPPGAPVPAHVYRYSHKLSFGTAVVNEGLPAACANLTCHSSDLIPVFGNSAGLGNFTAEERHLSETMGTYWANFAHSGDPNQQWANTSNTTVVHWPEYANDTRADLLITTPASRVETDEDHGGVCAFFDSIGYNH